MAQLRKGNPLFSGKSTLVKYSNLARNKGNYVKRKIIFCHVFHDSQGNKHFSHSEHVVFVDFFDLTEVGESLLLASNIFNVFQVLMWSEYQSYLDVFISGFLSKIIEKHYVKKLVACLWRNKWTIETNVGLQIKCLKKAPEPQGKVILNDAAESMKLHLKVWLALSKISRWCCSNWSQKRTTCGTWRMICRLGDWTSLFPHF